MTDRRQYPKPDNLDAMSAAHNDPVAFAAEVAKYNEQLRLAGFDPVTQALDFTEPRKTETLYDEEPF